MDQKLYNEMVVILQLILDKNTQQERLLEFESQIENNINFDYVNFT